MKGKYKDEENIFTVLIKQGEFDSIVFKQRKDKSEGFIWPTQSVKIWKKSILESNLALQPAADSRFNSGIGGNPNNSQFREEPGSRPNINVTESKFVERVE